MLNKQKKKKILTYIMYVCICVCIYVCTYVLCMYVTHRYIVYIYICICMYYVRTYEVCKKNVNFSCIYGFTPLHNVKQVVTGVNKLNTALFTLLNFNVPKI